jgi:hypothetical protein
MPEEIFIITIVSIVAAAGLLSLILTGIFKLIKAKLENDSVSTESIDPQFFKALGAFKKDTERRLAHIERIIADLEEEQYRVDENTGATKSIEIEEEDVRSSSEKGRDQDGNLKNMLSE